MATPTPGRSPYRTFGAWVIATLSLVLAIFFAAILLRDPSMVSAWLGLACFSIATVGAITTIELERRARRR